MGHADGAQERALLGRAGGADHRRTGALGELHGGEADAARGRVHEDGVALPHAGQLVEAELRRQEGDRDARASGEVEPRGEAEHEVRRRDHVAGEAPLDERDDFVAHRDVVTSSPTATTTPAHSRPDRPGGAGIHAQHVEHVPEVEAGGPHRHHRLPGAGHGRLGRFEHEAVERPPLVHGEPVAARRHASRPSRVWRESRAPRRWPLRKATRSSSLSPTSSSTTITASAASPTERSTHTMGRDGSSRVSALTIPHSGDWASAKRADSFEEIAEMSKKHGMEMFQKADEKHLKVMNEMKEIMQSPAAMKDWFDSKKREFDALPEDQ